MSRLLTVAAVALLSTASAGAQDTQPKGHPPHIDSVTLRTVTERYMTVYPDFAFHDEDGDALFVRRMLVDTNRPTPMGVQDGYLGISEAQQKAGAVYTGGFPCGPEKYYVALKAYIVDKQGNRSNTVEYTIHCNGG